MSGGGWLNTDDLLKSLLFKGTFVWNEPAAVKVWKVFIMRNSVQILSSDYIENKNNVADFGDFLREISAIFGVCLFVFRHWSQIICGANLNIKTKLQVPRNICGYKIKINILGSKDSKPFNKKRMWRKRKSISRGCTMLLLLLLYLPPSVPQAVGIHIFFFFLLCVRCFIGCAHTAWINESDTKD